MTIETAVTADDLLTALAAIAPQDRIAALSVRSVKILRSAADLCGVDAEDLTKKQAIRAIIENF